MSSLITIRNATLVLLIAGTWHVGLGQSTPPKPQPNARWMMDYPEQDRFSASDSDVRSDRRYIPFLKAYLTQETFFDAGRRPLWQVADEFLGVGSGKVKIYANRYVAIAGCVAHMCDTLQGFLWIDTAAKNPRVYFAAATMIDDQGSGGDQKFFHLWIFANQTLSEVDGSLERLPAEFLGPLTDWLGQLNAASVMFVGHVGEMIPLLPASMHPKGDSQVTNKDVTKESQ